MPTKKKIKTPKLTDEDRTYLLKTADTMIVHVKSFAAVCRYGVGARWCISTPSNNHHYKNYKRYKLIYFVLLKRNTPEEYKLCIMINKYNINKMECWGQKSDNRKLSKDLITALMPPDFMSMILQHAQANRKERKKKIYNHPYKPGQHIQGNRTDLVRFTKGRISKRTRRYYNPTYPIFQINLKEKFIKRAEVVETSPDSNTMKIKIIELHKLPKSVDGVPLDAVLSTIYQVRTHKHWKVLT